MKDLLELIENGWQVVFEKSPKFIMVHANKGTRTLEYAIDHDHPERKQVLLDAINTLKNASKG